MCEGSGGPLVDLRVRRSRKPDEQSRIASGVGDSSGWIRTTDLAIMSGLGARRARRWPGLYGKEIPANPADPDDPVFRD